jgi:hypothetical protein
MKMDRTEAAVQAAALALAAKTCGCEIESIDGLSGTIKLTPDGELVFANNRSNLYGIAALYTYRKETQATRQDANTFITERGRKVLEQLRLGTGEDDPLFRFGKFYYKDGISEYDFLRPLVGHWEVIVKSISDPTGWKWKAICNLTKDLWVQPLMSGREFVEKAGMEAFLTGLETPSEVTPTIDDKTRRSSAFHEAGHAIIGLSLGLADVVGVELSDGKNGSLGHVIYRNRKTYLEGVASPDMVFFGMSGEAASAVKDRKDIEATTGAKDLTPIPCFISDEKALLYLKTLRGPQGDRVKKHRCFDGFGIVQDLHYDGMTDEEFLRTLHAAWDWTVHLVSRPAFWKAITILADEVYEAHTLTGDQVNALLAKAGLTKRRRRRTK